jgi:TolB protein
VFASDRGGDFDLYRMKADGTGVTKLIAAGRQASYPDWSPDGSRIVFMVCDDIESEEGDIAVVGSDGKGFEILTAAGTGSRPVWSDDGSAILFSSRRTGSDEIYLMDPDGNHIRQIIQTGSDKRFARLSPDGEKIVFTAISPSGTDAQIHVINADGTGDKVLTDKGNLNTAPCWSADGKYIFFQSGRFGNSEIYRMDADGRNQVNLSRHESENFAPNSVRKAKTASVPGSPGLISGSGLRIYPVPANGSLTVEITLARPGHAEVSIVDSLGRVIRSVGTFDLVHGGLTCDLELGGLPPGCYGVMLATEDGRKVERFLKQ